VFIVAERLPWNIVPFIFSVFIVAQALKVPPSLCSISPSPSPDIFSLDQVAGWTAYAATGFAYVIGPEDSIRNATIAAFIFGLTRSLLNSMILRPLFTLSLLMLCLLLAFLRRTF